MGYNVEGLSTYVKENEGIILKDVVFGNVYGDTIPLMTKQLGVKTSEKIHPSTIEAILQDVLQDGTTCGFNSQGGLNFSERTINTYNKKVNVGFCEDTLLQKFAEYKVRIGADEGAMPFEAEIIEGLVKKVSEQVEDLVWSNLLNADGINGETLSATTAYDRVMEVYSLMPEAILEDGIIFVNPALFRAYVMELVNKNLYHYNPANGDLAEIFLPGSGVKVRKAKGIKTNDLFATSPKNMVYGTDFLNNKEEVKVWYSDDAGEWRIKMRFNAGAQVAFPDLVVKRTYA